MQSKLAKLFGWFGHEYVTRGSLKRDVPTSGNGWINYSCPIESWEFWEEKFAHEFSAKLRSEIALTLFDFRKRRNEWEAEAGKADKGKRLDSKQIKRGLKAAEKTGACSDPKCSIPDDHIDPRRSAFFMARSVMRDILSGVRPC